MHKVRSKQCWSEIASGTDYFDISGDYTLVITEDVLKSLQEGGLIIGGHDYTAVAVYLENNGTALDPNKDYAFYKADTEFDATNATVEGTWENKVFTEDLKKCCRLLEAIERCGYSGIVASIPRGSRWLVLVG